MSHLHKYVSQYQALVRSSGFNTWVGRIAIIVPSLVILASILCIRLYFRDKGAPLPDQALYALPAPFVFMLWLRIWDNGHPPLVRPSPFVTMAAYPLLFGAILVAAYPPWTEYRIPATFGAVFAAILMHASIPKLLVAIRKEPVAALLALLLGSILYLNAFFHELLWGYLCAATANMIMALASLASFPAEITTNTEKNLIYFGTFTYKVMLAPPCSGMDGIAIFFALLTTVFLADWNMFRRFPFLRLYLAGFLMIFLINALRIMVLFSIGFIGAHPNAPEWLKPLKDTMFSMFHDHVGWTVYVAAFVVFVTPLYKAAASGIVPQLRKA